MTIAPGLCSITFRSLAAEEVLQIAVRAGIDGIEWGADGHAPPGGGPGIEALRTRCVDAGIEVASYGSYLGATPPHGDATETEAVEPVLDSAEALGAPMVRIWTELGVTQASPVADRQRVAERTAAIANAIVARGLLAALEFHPGTLTETAASANDLLDAVANPSLRTHWQPDPTLSAADALAELERLTAHLAHLHVFTWGLAGMSDRRPLAEGVDLWRAALTVADRNAAALPCQRFALCEYVRNDDVDQLLIDVRALRTWLGALDRDASRARR
jgi:sugar phosphate isomerase/epimerase